ncbi:Hypothetical protein A7982_09087 [Minicystis rosea]|nr:Hypothetical protein A7982_09087 [Minicystis rosea]
MRRRAFFSLPLILGALASATPALAAGLPALVVHRTEDTADCPDARALADKVAEQMHRPALTPLAEVVPGAERGLDVQIYKSSEGYTAVIQAAGKTRQLSDKGASCGGLAAALAISIAVLLDTEPLPPAPELPPAPPVEPPPPALPAVPELVLPPPPIDDERPSDVRRFRVAIAASPVITAGMLRPFAGGITSEIEIRFGRFSIAGGAFALPGQTVDYAPGQVKLSLTTGLLRGCVAPISIGGSTSGGGEDEAIRFAICLDTLAGAVRGAGQGYKTNKTLSLPWAEVGPSALFAQRIWGPLSWGARAMLVIPVLKQSFFVDNLGTAFAPSPVGGALDAGLRVSIW